MKRYRWLRVIKVFGILGGSKYQITPILRKSSNLMKLKYDKHDLLLRSFSTDMMLADSILIGKFRNRKWVGEYTLVEKYLMKRKKNPIVIDAGANIGLFTRWVLKRKPEAKIYAIEPEAENYKILKQNVKGYSVECMQRGLWSKKCFLEVIPRDTGAWGFMVKEAPKEGINTVKAISVANMIEHFGIDEIDLFKIDIEGSEYELFRQADMSWLERCHALVVETHDHIVAGSDELVNRVLGEHGYRKYMYEENQFFIKEG